MRLLLLLVFVALAWLTPTQAGACGGLGPSFTLLTDARGGVPAGTKVLTLYIYGTSIEPAPPKVILSANRGGLPVTVPVTLRVAAPWLLKVDLGSAAIQAGTRYSLSVETVPVAGASVGNAAQLSFDGVAASPMPSELGTLVLDKRASGTTTVGICPEGVHGEHVLIKLAASAAAEPWTRAVKHQLFVDGKPSFEPEVPLVDPTARKMEPVIRAYARCAPVAGAAAIPFELGIELPLEAGEHSVKWASTFPDGTTLETPAVAVDLRCAVTPATPTPRPPCCKTLPPEDAGVALPVGVNTANVVDAGPGHAANAPYARDGGPVQQLVSSQSPAPAAADEPDGSEGCTLGRGQRGGAQALGLLLVLCLLHARLARRRA